jgi:hypothetical protein
LAPSNIIVDVSPNSNSDSNDSASMPIMIIILVVVGLLLFIGIALVYKRRKPQVPERPSRGIYLAPSVKQGYDNAVILYSDENAIHSGLNPTYNRPKSEQFAHHTYAAVDPDNAGQGLPHYDAAAANKYAAPKLVPEGFGGGAMYDSAAATAIATGGNVQQYDMAFDGFDGRTSPMYDSAAATATGGHVQQYDTAFV